MVSVWACTEDAADNAVPEEKEGQEAVVETDLHELSLSLVEESDGVVTVELLYARPPDAAGPRMMELFLRPSDGLKYLSGKPLSAVEKAGKQLVLQEQENGDVRTVVFATTNLDRLASGPLVRYRFSLTSGSGAAVEMVDRRPVFAPAEADTVTLGKPLRIGGR